MLRRRRLSYDYYADFDGRATLYHFVSTGIRLHLGEISTPPYPGRFVRQARRLATGVGSPPRGV